MRVVVQRVSRARVTVDGEEVGAIGRGLVALVGIAPGDTEEDLELMAEKLAHLRVFEDAEGKMNRSLLETGGGILAISQFTLLANCRKGRRPSFAGAAPPERARQLFDEFLIRLRDHIRDVQTGEFQAMMDVELVNTGPVTIVLDTEELRAPRRQA